MRVFSGTNNLVQGNDLYDGGTGGEFSEGSTAQSRKLIRAQESVQAGDSVGNTAAETNFASNHVFPASALAGIGKVLKVEAWGTYSTLGSGTVTLQLKLKFGTTTAIDFGTITTAISITSRLWFIRAQLTVTALGASGTIECHGEARIPTANDAVTASRPAALTGPLTLDLTASQTLQISAQHGAASASNAIQMRQFTVEVSG